MFIYIKSPKNHYSKLIHLGWLFYPYIHQTMLANILQYFHLEVPQRCYNILFLKLAKGLIAQLYLMMVFDL